MGLSPTDCQTAQFFVPVHSLEDTGFGGGGGGIEGVPQNGFFGTTPCFLAIAEIKKQNVHIENLMHDPTYSVPLTVRNK